MMAPAVAPVTGKRKREQAPSTTGHSKKAASASAVNGKIGHAAARVEEMIAQVEAESTRQRTNGNVDVLTEDGYLHVQVVTGSYERALHGFSATIPRSLLRPAANEATTASEAISKDTVTFSETFLFAAHASSIRCLAMSPPTESDKRFLATGSSDERINVYSISTAPPPAKSAFAKPTLSGSSISENPRNRSLGSLVHHDRAITRLEFPAKGKLFSGAEDNTIAISRTRDWTVLSSIKAPIPKAQGRPSGDTAGPGETPAGVNDFAIHPSQKLMLSVGRGERCLRLWNLMTGKKAGVLNFDRDLLMQVGEGKYSSGEGRRVLWNTAGDAYVVGFERGAAVFGMDSKPRAIIKPTSPTKLHQFRMLNVGVGEDATDLLAVSTEDGRVQLFDLDVPEGAAGDKALPMCVCLAQLGGRAAGVSGRIKDFDVVDMPALSPALLIVTASSDGAVRLWSLPKDISALRTLDTTVEGPSSSKASSGAPKQVGDLLGTLETSNRITCVGAFLMDGKRNAEHTNPDEEEFGGFGVDDAEGEESDESEQ